MYFIQKNITRFQNLSMTYFLNPSELKELCSHMKKKDYLIYKPYPDSEKNIVYQGEQPEVLLYEIICHTPIRHQDILGTLYSLNIASDLFGDVLVIQNHYYVYILPIVQNYFETNFTMIKNSRITLKQIPVDTLQDYEREYETIEMIVSSCRIDTVLSSILHVSRGMIDSYLKDKDVLLNYEVLKDPSYKLKEEDVFSIRKVGKYRFLEILRNTKGNHFVIALKKYI
ncbi:MAG: hypothetical protein J6X28_00255 [Bacilli bacterium]|nr:hypothetical protein [Bacilli bacterium]